MRIIAGRLRSRRFEAPAGLATRPTSDRLRETLFNVLAARTEGAAFLDLYAGSGAVGMEALSRGAARVVFVERVAGALKVLRGNLAGLELGEGVEVRAEGVGTYLRRVVGSADPRSPSARDLGHPAAKVRRPGFDVVFLDPPYDAEGEYEMTLGLLGDASFHPRSPSARDLGHPLLNQGATVIAEHRRKDVLKDRYGALERTRLLLQGDAALSFYARSSQQVSELASQPG
ncbi:MAG TPA: RsmD family RNA methyltransferase [Terracidiphilus sp.]|jgi:16S rRNA (guanine(966)-N(2))-methyltransferase RsmD|nr:RsmD family RNA methyltransferase [Terracidiphilus sp.]